MILKKQICLIVDAYTTGKYLAPALIANGYQCWHVQSKSEVIKVYQQSYIAQNFQKNLIYEGDIDKLLAAVAQHSVKAVIPGAETGVILADLLAEKLGLPGNPSNSSESRRSKFLMYEALQNKNVPTVPFLRTAVLDDIFQWQALHNLQKIVLKPLSGGGSDHVFICNSKQDIEVAHEKILGESDVFGQTNIQLLAQDFLDGQEYIVNTVSVSKKHYVVDVWKKFKINIGGVPINLHSIAIDFNNSEYSALVNYVYNVLDALEICYGAAHTELMMTKNGPCLIETGARLAGSIDPSALNEIRGTNHVQAVIDAAIHPSTFTLNDNYSLKKAGMHFFLASDAEGKIWQEPDFSKLFALSTFHSLSFAYAKSDWLRKTTSLANFPGFGYLVGSTHEKLLCDYELLRKIENIAYSDMLHNKS